MILLLTPSWCAGDLLGQLKTPAIAGYPASRAGITLPPFGFTLRDYHHLARRDTAFLAPSDFEYSTTCAGVVADMCAAFDVLGAG